MADTSKQMKAAMDARHALDMAEIDAQIARGRERQANYYRSLGAVSGVGAPALPPAPLLKSGLALSAEEARQQARQQEWAKLAAGAATGAAVGAPPVPAAAPVSLDSILMRSIAVPPTSKK